MGFSCPAQEYTSSNYESQSGDPQGAKISLKDTNRNPPPKKKAKTKTKKPHKPPTPNKPNQKTPKYPSDILLPPLNKQFWF